MASTPPAAAATRSRRRGRPGEESHGQNEEQRGHDAGGDERHRDGGRHPDRLDVDLGAPPRPSIGACQMNSGSRRRSTGYSHTP
jgi:hypothetical protein